MRQAEDAITLDTTTLDADAPSLRRCRSSARGSADSLF